MKRLTKLDIQHTLLSGRSLDWIDAAGKQDAIELKSAAQRRLFAYLLNSPVREPKALPSDFVSGLTTAYTAENDPASDRGETASTVESGPWRLQKIETHGFGGLNVFGGPTFSHEFDGESLILQGPNGSGKSSLVGAVIWAMTGERPRDHATAHPEERAEVYGKNNRKTGTWPPIACYPDNVLGLVKDPSVRVTLTFIDANGTSALVERRLEGGQVTSTFDPALSAPEVLVETGLIMPLRMPQIRFEKGPTPLTRAVQSLTGLDDLIDIGTLVDGLCHRGREYLSTNEKQVQHHKALFESALGEAQRAIKPTGDAIKDFQPRDTVDADGPFAQLGRKLRARAAELTQVVSDDLVPGLNLTNANVQMEIAGAITMAKEEVAAGLQELPTWKTLSGLESDLNKGVSERLRRATDEAEAALKEAFALDMRAKSDTRLQLKALGAQWHEMHMGSTELTNCPLCEKKIDDLALKSEMDALRRANEMAARQFADNLNSIHAGLTAALPSALEPKLSELAVLVPRQMLISDLDTRLGAKPSIKNALATFVRLAKEALSFAPEPELPLPENAETDTDGVSRVRAQIAAARRLLSLRKWRSENAEAWQEWWQQTAGLDVEALPKEERADKETEPPRVCRRPFRLSHAAMAGSPGMA